MAGAFLAAAFFAGAFLAAAFLAGAFLAAAFLAGAFLAAAFLAGAFLAGAFLAAPSWPAAFLAGAFLAAAFLAGAFFAAAFFAAAFFAAIGVLYFFPLSVDFRVELAVNFIAVEAAIFTGAPVCGLRPVRAGRLVVLNEPKPGHATLSPFLVVATTVSKKAPIVRSASALDTPAASATASMSSALVIDDSFESRSVVVGAVVVLFENTANRVSRAFTHVLIKRCTNYKDATTDVIAFAIACEFDVSARSFEYAAQSVGICVRFTLGVS